MAELAGGAERAAVELAVQDEPAADPGAERQHDHVPRPPPRAQTVLGDRGGVRVVLERDREPERSREPVAEVDAGERDVDGGAARPVRWSMSEGTPIPSATTLVATSSSIASSICATSASCSSVGRVLDLLP